MRSVSTFDEWRHAARPLLAHRISPDSVEWGHAWALRNAAGQEQSAGAAPLTVDSQIDPPRISASLLKVLEAVSLHRDTAKWDLMYRLAWRALTQNSRLMDDAADPDVHRAQLMERAIRRDIHKMHAFVRFKEVVDAAGGTSYFAWFEPEHLILREGVKFFIKRFVNMTFTLATPHGAAVWKDRELKLIDSPDAADRPRTDEYEGLWRTYYRSICNVARINPTAMQREMPQRFWKHLPEASEINVLIRDGVSTFVKKHRESPDEGNIMARTVKRLVPASVESGEGPQSCRRCDLWQHATQAVEGEGAAPAKIMLVGEQPGDEEDLQGHPFIGPAGRVLSDALASAGLSRDALFITNAVKHFKWEPRGKRRLHKKPGVAEINACQVWLLADIARAAPLVIVALGATALRALTGKTMSIDGARRESLSHSGGARIIATYHPSAILRAEGDRVEEFRNALIADLTKASQLTANDPQVSP